MSEQNTIPAEMLDAAARVIAGYDGWPMPEIHVARLAEAALQAADVPKLVARIASAEQIIASRQGELNTARARIAELEAELATHQESKFHPDWSLLDATRGSLREHQEMIQSKDARIAELEAALRNRICEGCDKLMANVGQLHLCGCEDQRNLCSACKAGCACAGGE